MKTKSTDKLKAAVEKWDTLPNSGKVKILKEFSDDERTKFWTLLSDKIRAARQPQKPNLTGGQSG